MKEEKKKDYVKPEIKKHEAIAVVSGSCGCSSYSASSCGSTYYH